MSNDKTLATAKHGGCVQLGDGLAIEKRAREMLADQIETIQGYALAAQELRDGVALDGYSMLPAALSAIIAALSAHPFRDGQRDDSDLLAELRDVEEYLYYGGSNPIHTATVRAAINALSTQPSPGGQGDADPDVVALDVARRFTPDGEPQRRARLQVAIVTAIAAANAEHIPVGYTLLDDIDLCRLRERAELPMRIEKGELWHWQGDGHDFPESLACPVVMTADTLRALIAARQPVGEPVARLIEAIEGECSGLAINNETADAILAHVFSLGHAPAAYMVDGRLEQGLFFDKAAAENMAAMNAGDVVPLFRPTAQAVDLGEFRPAVITALGHSSPYGLERENLNRLLALIDSHSAGGQP